MKRECFPHMHCSWVRTALGSNGLPQTEIVQQFPPRVACAADAGPAYKD
jgi:hypothetical protein